MRVMKTLPYLTLAIITATVPLVQAYESKRTAEHILASPADFEGKEVTLDVSFVKPVQWKSPVAELAFFHVMTIDRVDKRPGGHILVAVLATESSKFAKKYGMDFDGKNKSLSLSGILVATPGKGNRLEVWIVDTTGKIPGFVKDKKLIIEDAGDVGGPLGGPPHAPKRLRFR